MQDKLRREASRSHAVSRRTFHVPHASDLSRHAPHESQSAVEPQARVQSSATLDVDEA